MNGIVDKGHGTPIVLIPGVQGRWEWMRPTVDALATSAVLWVLMLTPSEAQRKSGMLSPHFWLRDL